MDIGVIGAGRVGVSIGKYLKLKGIKITGYYSRKPEDSQSAADFTGSICFSDISKLVDVSEVIFIAVSDDMIANVWKQIRNFKLSSKIICHFSGVLSSEVFEGIEECGAAGCCIHPMYAFSDRYNSYKNMDKISFVIEGMDIAVKSIENMLNSMSHKTYRINSENKAKYHAAAAIASNHMAALFYDSIKLLEESGFGKEDAIELLTPLVRENIHNILENGCVEALTGPIARNDLNTVKLHLDALKSSYVLDSYLATARTLVEIASLKTPEYNYDEMLKLIN